jgi:hypothetical protein
VGPVAFWYGWPPFALFRFLGGRCMWPCRGLCWESLVTVNPTIIGNLPLGLTDIQMNVLWRAAASLPVASRSSFLRGVASRCPGSPTDPEFQTAVAAALRSAPGARAGWS